MIFKIIIIVFVTTLFGCGFELVNQNYFKEMNLINKDFSFQDLSMGMSSDYLKASENSATYLRIGSSIFGKRS